MAKSAEIVKIEGISETFPFEVVSGLLLVEIIPWAKSLISAAVGLIFVENEPTLSDVFALTPESFGRKEVNEKARSFFSRLLQKFNCNFSSPEKSNSIEPAEFILESYDGWKQDEWKKHLPILAKKLKEAATNQVDFEKIAETAGKTRTKKESRKMELKPVEEKSISYLGLYPKTRKLLLEGGTTTIGQLMKMPIPRFKETMGDNKKTQQRTIVGCMVRKNLYFAEGTAATKKFLMELERELGIDASADPGKSRKTGRPRKNPLIITPKETEAEERPPENLIMLAQKGSAENNNAGQKEMKSGNAVLFTWGIVGSLITALPTEIVIQTPNETVKIVREPHKPR